MKNIIILLVAVIGIIIIANTPSVFAQWNDDGTVVRLDTSTDSVGIGTSTPGAKLEVTGKTYMFNGTSDALLVGCNSSENITFTVQDNHGYIDYEQDEDSNGPHRFYIRNLASGTGENDIRLQTREVVPKI